MNLTNTLTITYRPPALLWKITQDRLQFQLYTVYDENLGKQIHRWRLLQCKAQTVGIKNRNMAMKQNNMDYLTTGQPTYWPSDLHKIPDLIDFCVTNGINTKQIQTEFCLDLPSDHSPITMHHHAFASPQKTKTTNALQQQNGLVYVHSKTGRAY